MPVFALFLISSLVSVPAAGAPRFTLVPTAASHLRYRLENLFNEVDLLIRNRKTDEADLKRQERDFEALKVMQRIPLQEDLTGLKASLRETARELGVELEGIRVRERLTSKKKIPAVLYSDRNDFKLLPDDVAETIRFRAFAQGDEASIHRWISTWKAQQLRLVELEPESPKNLEPVQHLSGKRWAIRAQTFRYRDIRFPKILTRNPMDLLPTWARQDTARFCEKEPVLWSFVQRIQKLAPQARPYYENRAQFLLNGARMDFFLAKAVPR